jgi:hypothetical protein
MASIVALFFVLVSLAEGLLLFRAARRLLQFDDLFQDTAEVLDGYSSDLAEMSSADLDGILVDHPEVIAFHKRNMRARRDVQSILDSVTAVSPRRPRRRDPKLPLPDME